MAEHSQGSKGQPAAPPVNGKRSLQPPVNASKQQLAPMGRRSQVADVPLQHDGAHTAAARADASAADEPAGAEQPEGGEAKPLRDPTAKEETPEGGRRESEDEGENEDFLSQEGLHSCWIPVPSDAVRCCSFKEGDRVLDEDARQFYLSLIHKQPGCGPAVTSLPSPPAVRDALPAMIARAKISATSSADSTNEQIERALRAFAADVLGYVEDRDQHREGLRRHQQPTQQPQELT
eukprot:GHVT01002781.1.p1 GENE.GHVT01002781.1~~GHVT01002781.1.p1  ORF type:complete len:268 (-),score=68.03 GHVT01002781.1:629-1333(-)